MGDGSSLAAAAPITDINNQQSLAVAGWGRCRGLAVAGVEPAAITASAVSDLAVLDPSEAARLADTLGVALAISACFSGGSTVADVGDREVPVD